MRPSMRAVGVLSLTCTILATAARGQVHDPQFGLGAGVYVPTGEFRADDEGYGFDVGWMLAAHIDIREAGPLWIRLSASLGENGANDKMTDFVSTAAGRRVDIKTRLLSLMLDATYHLRSSKDGLTAYVLAGSGFSNVTFDLAVSGGTADTSEIKFAWNLGAGVSRRVGGSVYFLEARHVWIADVFGATNLSYLPVTLGARLRL